MNEHSFVKAVNTKLKKDFPEVYQWKIHDSFTGGVPDAFYSGVKDYLFVEYKFVKPLPKRDSTEIDLTNPKFLSYNQQEWLQTQDTNNINIAIIIGSNEGALICPQLTWKNKIKSKDLKNNFTPQIVSQWINNHCNTKGKGYNYEAIYHPQFNGGR